MKSLHKLLEAARAQLSRLNAASRLLIGSLAVILAMALFIVGLYAGRSTLVPLPVPLDGESRAAVTSYLNARHIEWEDRGGQIAVPESQRHVLLAELTDREIISPETIDFDALVSQESPFLSKAQNERRWLVATMNQLERTIRAMRGIASADVVIDEPSRPGGIGRSHVPPSASVTVTTQSGPLRQEQVDAIAAMVAGAHAELTVAQVEVIDAGAGRRLRASDDRALASRGYLELQAEHTRLYEEKLEKALGYIAGVNVAVNVIVDQREVVEESRRFDEPRSGVTEETSRTLSQNNQPAAFEPGVRSNTGASLGSASGRGASLSDERSESRLKPVFGGTDSRTLDPGGHALKVNASIGVPRSYFVRLFADEAGNAAAQPSPAELDPLVQREVERIRAQVEPLVVTGPKGGEIDGTVAVSMIPDAAAPAAAEADGALLAGGVLSESLFRYAALGGLALVSLAMMLMMVRKAAQRTELPGASEPGGAAAPPLAVADVEITGEAGTSALPLEAIELDEGTLRRDQMVAQINQMSLRRPDEAARILHRWVQQQAS